jgi:TolB-like protein/tetratricopeptide (TPR) repeat protein
MSGREQLTDEGWAVPAARLESWKEIASYLRRGVRTVRRWEKDEGLPVRRQLHKKLGTVYAYGPELDAWRESRVASSGAARAGRADSPRRVMLAVLPFSNLSGDPEQDYVAEGLTEEIIGQVGRINPDVLGVIARTTTMQYRGTGRTVRQIGDELRVDYVVEGGVRREGDRVRVVAQLIHVRDQAQVWSGTREYGVGSMLTLQRELAGEIGHEIRARLSPGTRGPSVDRVSTDAYHAYLKGRHFLNRFTPQSVQRSVEYFRRAIDADPAFAPAHAGLAEACEQLPMWLDAPAANTLPRALAAAEQALRLDPDLPEAHASLGLIHANYTWAWSEAEKHFRRALALNPSSSQARLWYAEFLAEMGRIDDALDVIEPACALDPLSCAVQATRAFAFWMGRRHDEAIRHARLALEIDPGFPMALIRLGMACVCKDAHAEGIIALRQAAESAPGLLDCQALLGYAHARAGDRRAARARLEALRRLGRQQYVPPFLFAIVHVGLGDHDAAVRQMEREYRARGWYLLLLKHAPQFDAMRSHAGFQALVRRMRFPGEEFTRPRSRG